MSISSMFAEVKKVDVTCNELRITCVKNPANTNNSLLKINNRSTRR